VKLKLILVTGFLVSAFATVKAHADCSLTIQPSPFVPRGQFYSYGLQLTDGFGPPPPPSVVFTVVFHGTKNGVVDTPPAGEFYPGTFGLGTHNLTGFQNPPAGGLTGQYVRFAFIYDQSGNLTCVTNPVVVTLQ
jgi:hypothetical protein